MKISRQTILAALAIGVAGGLFCERAQAQGPIVGNITFAGTANLDTTSVNTATVVTAWHGLSTTPSAGLPQVESRDGTFTAFVTPGDGTTFHAPWTFNSGPISSFWSVDGFTFNLLNSTIVQQGGGSLFVQGTGDASGNGFATTPGSFNFTTQDPSASSQFSWSAASAVPEAGSVALFAIGATCLAGSKFLLRKK